MTQIEHVLQVAKHTQISEARITTVLNFLNEGATVPFIARYRKDQTGGLEDFEIFNIQKQAQSVDELIKRKQYILESLSKLSIKNADLDIKINECWNKQELEDLFAPYKSKRKTKASIARENGLEGLAKIIMSQKGDTINTARFVKAPLQTEQEALEGAMHIVQEWIAEHMYAKNQLRRLFTREGVLTSKLKKGKENEASTYKTYFDFEQKASRIPSHRVLAILRATDEGLLSSGISVDKKKRH